MGSLSNFAELEILDHSVGEGAYAMPTCHLALCTADPTDAGTGADCSEVADANNYSRAALVGKWSPAAAGAITNDVAITFPEASGAWGEITHFAIIDGAVHGAGNMIWHGALAASKVVGNGDTVQVAIGDLDLTLD